MACIPQRNFLRLFVFLFLLLSFSWVSSSASDSSPRHLYFGIDAIPFHIFLEAQERGLFKDFQPPSRVIAVFPSLSNYAWATILNTENLESYQAKYYHFGFNKIVGRLLYEVAKPPYPNKFDFCDSRVLKKVLAYITSGGSIKGEMKHLAETVLASNEPRLLFALTGTSDIVAHMKGAKGLNRLLEVVDREISRIREEHLKKFNEPLAVTLLSDHGQTLVSGKIINVAKPLKENGFNLRKKLKGPDDVIYHSSGILSVALFFIQDERKIELARVLASQPWTDLAITFDKEKGLFLVFSKSGSLAFEYREENNEFRIRNIEGEDPLGLTQQDLPVGEWLPYSTVFDASLHTKFPDSLLRIQRGLSHQGVNHPASVAVSLKIGCESGSKFMKFLSIFKGRKGTHGALSDVESLGFLSSTDYSFPDWVPSRDIHTLIEGHDFEKRFEPLTLLNGENGQCKLRFGHPLLDIPGVAQVRFAVQTYDHDVKRFPNSYEIFEVKIPSHMSDVSFYGQPRYFDVKLPKTFDPMNMHQFQVHVLNLDNRIIARFKTERFRIMPFRGYQIFYIKKIFNPPKKHLSWK